MFSSDALKDERVTNNNQFSEDIYQNFAIYDKTGKTEIEKVKDQKIVSNATDRFAQGVPGSQGSAEKMNTNIEDKLEMFKRTPNLQYSWQVGKNSPKNLRKNNDIIADLDQTEADEADTLENQLQLMMQKNNELESQIYALTEENVKLKNVQSSLLQLSQNVNSSIQNLQQEHKNFKKERQQSPEIQNKQLEKQNGDLQARLKNLEEAQKQQKKEFQEARDMKERLKQENQKMREERSQLLHTITEQ